MRYFYFNPPVSVKQTALYMALMKRRISKSYHTQDIMKIEEWEANTKLLHIPQKTDIIKTL